ncbi:MAG: hypothetical protein JSS65_13415 [Armatimonadetes bacterium]|nr:hypothetical protein [Armatimonadota bacterium]
MKFRRLYWVTEQVGLDGTSHIGGVYTSINDLLERGLHWDADSDKTASFRVSLVKLDSTKPPLGQWSSPDFSGMRAALQEYVETDEFNAQECELLVDNLHQFAKAS